MSISMEIERIIPFLESSEEVLAVYLYGSRIKGKSQKQSDLDIALLLGGVEQISEVSDKEIKYALGIEKILKNVEVDIKILNTAPIFFQYKVIGEGNLIFCRNHRARIRYEVMVADEYFDFKPLLDYYDRCMYQNVKKDYRGFRYSSY